MDARQGQPQSSPSPSFAASSVDSNWVPDVEVNECPLCNRRFQALLVPKHHCRACGRIVCGSCSNNKIFVPQKGTKARVCDPCNDLSRIDTHSELTDSLTTSRQMETSLKSNLKEMTQQADWFRSFLLQITSEANAPPGGVHSWGGSTTLPASSATYAETPSVDYEDTAGDIASSFVTTNSELVTEEELEAPERSASPFETSSAGSKDGLSVVLANLRNPEIADLIARSRRRWKETCVEVSACREENGRLEMDIEVLDRDYSDQQQEIKTLYKAVKNMEADLKNRSIREAERDELKHRTEQLQSELDGLNQRRATLEEGLPGTRSGSFFSNAGSDGGEVTRRRCCKGSTDSQGREERRCIRPGGGCSIM